MGSTTATPLQVPTTAKMKSMIVLFVVLAVAQINAHPHPSSSVYPVEAVLDSELETLVLSDLQLPVLQLPTLITVESPAAREMVSALLASSVTTPVETDSPTHSANKSSFKCL